MSDRLTIRSYRRVWNVDQRLYTIDTFHLPVPGGIPLRGIAYWVAVLAAVIVLSMLPIFGQIFGVFSWFIRYVILTTIIAVIMFRAYPDGRPAHRFVYDWVRFKTRPRRTCAGERVPLEGEPIKSRLRMRMWHDANTSELQRVRLAGPATVLFNVPVRTKQTWRGRVLARPRPSARPMYLTVDPGVTLEVKP